VYKLKEKKRGGLERSFGSHTGHKTAGNVRSLIANHVTGFENSYFLDLLGNSEIKTANWKLGKWKKNSSSGQGRNGCVRRAITV